jgi:hypothetical protein
MAYDDLKDADYAETRIKSPGKSKGRKGNTPPSTYKIPDLINEGDYTAATATGGDNASLYDSTRVPSASPVGQNVKYQPPRDAGKMSISDLPGQETRAIPVPARRASK